MYYAPCTDVSSYVVLKIFQDLRPMSNNIKPDIVLISNDDDIRLYVIWHKAESHSHLK